MCLLFSELHDTLQQDRTLSHNKTTATTDAKQPTSFLAEDRWVPLREYCVSVLRELLYSTKWSYNIKYFTFYEYLMKFVTAYNQLLLYTCLGLFEWAKKCQKDVSS